MEGCCRKHLIPSHRTEPTYKPANATAAIIIRAQRMLSTDFKSYLPELLSLMTHRTLLRQIESAWQFEGVTRVRFMRTAPRAIRQAISRQLCGRVLTPLAATMPMPR